MFRPLCASNGFTQALELIQFRLSRESILLCTALNLCVAITVIPVYSEVTLISRWRQ